MAAQLALNCDAVDDLAACYALDALPDGELRAVQAHLSTCERPHPSLHEFAETAALLALVCEEAVPPASLGRRIRDLAAADLDSPSPAPLSLQGSGRAPAPLRQRRRSTAVLPWLAAAAVLAALAVGLGLWGATEHAQLGQRAAALQSDRTVLAALAAGATVLPLPGSGAQRPAVLVQPRDGSAAYLVVDAPALANGKVYAAWYINGSSVALAGSFSGSSNGPQVVRLSGPLTAARAVAVTIEPKGSATPTGPKILERTLS